MNLFKFDIPRALYLIGLAGLLVLGGCASEGEKESPKTEKKAETAKKAGPQKTEPLTDETAVEALKKYGAENPETVVLMKTRLGDMKIKLYENTPLHRANFIRLAKSGYFENTQFYRVVKDFMIQGGDSDDLAQRKKKRALGKYTLPAEIVQGNYHRKGALASARNYENNPQKRSACYEFYIVHGLVYSKPLLNQLALENKTQFNATQEQLYTSVGGAPHLDGEHTVFGQVVEGLEVIDKIAALEVGEGDWPLDYVFISVTVLE